MYKIVYTNRMKKDVRRAKKRGKNLSKLIEVLNLLQTGEPLPEKYDDHQLGGNLKDFRECHIEYDWLLMYQIYEDALILYALRRVRTRIFLVNKKISQWGNLTKWTNLILKQTISV